MNLRKARFYVERGGIAYCCELWLQRHGAISEEAFATSKGNARFVRYYENLRPEDYEAELRDQFDSILAGSDTVLTDAPETFNEKIQWLKVHDTTALKTRLADKLEVRAWVAEKVGPSYLVPLAGGPWGNADDIGFDCLPDRFALKATHGSGMNLIVKDKGALDVAHARSRANIWLHTLFGWRGLEAQYFRIPRRVYAEEYIEQENGDLVDYKIHCFDGVPRIIQIIGSRDFETHTAREAFFDVDWNRVDVMYHTYDDYDDPPQPSSYLGEMLGVAERLSEGFRYVRVDLYEVGGRVYFGEMTFTPANGFGAWGGRGGLEASGLIVR